MGFNGDLMGYMMVLPSGKSNNFYGNIHHGYHRNSGFTQLENSVSLTITRPGKRLQFANWKNGHRNFVSFFHEKWWIFPASSQTVNVYQRVANMVKKAGLCYEKPT